MDSRDKLTVKQELFCQKHHEGESGAASYRAVYDAENMTDQSVYSAVTELLKNPKITRRLEELADARLRRHEITVDSVLVELAKLSFWSIKKLFDDDGNLKAISELDSETAAAVSGVEFEEVFEMQGTGKERRRVHVGRIHKIKLSDKKPALELLGKNLKLFSDKIDLQSLDKEGKPTDPVAADPILAAALAMFDKGKATKKDGPDGGSVA